MSKKDYEKLANLVAEYYKELPRGFCEQLLNILKNDNPRFDKYKFITAVGIRACEMYGRKG